MINKINSFQPSNYRNLQNLNCKPKNNNSEQKSNSYNLPSYYISFTAKLKNNESRQGVIFNNMDSQAKSFLADLMGEAKKTGYSAITPLHVIKTSLEELDEYLDELDNGEIEYSEDDVPYMGALLMADSSKTFISNPKYRKIARPIIKQEIAELENLIFENKPKSVKITDKINISEELIDTIWQFANRDDLNVDTEAVVNAAINCPSPIIKNNYESFLLKLDEAVMTNNMPLSKRTPFSEYEKKAQNVLKNLALGTNIFLTYDKDKISEKNFIDTIINVNEKNSDSNTKITQLNNEIGMDYFSYLLKKLGKEKDLKHIIILDPMMLITNSSSYEMLNQGQIGITPEFMQILNKPQASNVRFLFVDTKNNYYNIWKNIISSNNFQEVPIPTLNTKQMIKSFKENPNLTKKIQVPFSTKAMERVVEASANIDGTFPQKTLDLMKNIAGYYIDKDQITENDVNEYINEAEEVFTNNKNSGSVEVVFDTGKKLKDIVGKNATSKEAQMLVKQIKSKKMGTKGVVIYSQDGTPGSGRKYTAKAIAGEANIPYVEINTMDFGTEKVSIFDEEGVSPEDSIKKIFSLVTTQAENNPNKSAVLFIENFEYFSVGELVSRYHQKAMAQLLREMDRADKLGLNILVFGSVSDPKLIGQSTLKSFKFIDKIAVETPAYNIDNRVEIIRRALKDNNIKLAGNKNEQEEIINLVATITHGFPFIYIKNLVKKAQNVAMERHHKSPNKADFTEAYLQLTTGRASSSRIDEHEKLLTTSHECGHATNLEVMNNLMKTQGQPWHVPDKVNFVTLDPRGFYGGAVYHGKDTNSEMSFEKIFSSMICAFGGNSAEAKFFKMDGSYGISCDMEQVRNLSEVMVKVMGLGKNVGKMAIDDDEYISNELKNLIEQDERIIINNAKVASDIITDTYKEFNEKFVEKYAHLVGTGDCLIIGDEFRTMLNDWKQNCSVEDKKKIEICNKALLDIIEYTKQGIKVKKAE